RDAARGHGRGVEDLELFLVEDLAALLVAALGEAVVAAVVADAVGARGGAATRAVVDHGGLDLVVRPAQARPAIGVTAFRIGHGSLVAGCVAARWRPQ